MWDPFTSFERFELPNGLRCHVATLDRPWEYVGVLIHAGAAYDPRGREGMAHFVEHLLPEVLSGITFAALREEFDGRSISYDFGSTRERVNQLLFRVPIAGDNLERVFDVVGRMLFLPTFTDDELVGRERLVVLEEANERLPFSIERRWRMERGRMFWGPKHRLVRFLGPCGLPSTIRMITAHDLRAWHAQYYTPCNVDIVLCGGLAFEAVQQLVARSSLTVDRPSAPSAIPLPANVALYRARRHAMRFSEHLKAAVDYGKIEIIVPCPRQGLSDGILVRACEAINEALFRHVRERLGGDYDLSVHALEHPECFELILSGNFAAHLAPEIERLIHESLALAEDAALIQRFIVRAINNCALLDFNGQDVATAALSSLADERRIVTVAEHLARARAVMVADVQSTIRLFAPERRWTLLCTP